MEAEYKLTENDYFHFNLFIFYGGIKKYIVGFSIAVFLTMFIMDVYQSIKYGLTIDLLSIILYITFIILFLIVIPFVLKVMAKKNFKNDKDEVENQKYIFTEDGITEVFGLQNFTVGWENIYRVHETIKYFYVFIQKDKAFILPKRAFSGNNEIEEIEKIFKNNLEKGSYKTI